MQVTEFDSQVDLNSYISPGQYAITALDGSSNVPVATPVVFHLEVKYAAGNRRIQTIVTYNSNEIYERVRTNQGTWSNWQRIDNFGCSTASELASLLGATRTGSISLTAGTPALLLSNVTSALIYVYETTNMGVCSVIMAGAAGFKVVSEVPNDSPMDFTFDNRKIYVDMNLTAGTQRTVHYKVLFLT